MLKKLTIIFLLFLIIGCFNNNDNNNTNDVSDTNDVNDTNFFEGHLEHGISYKVTKDTVILDWGQQMVTGFKLEIIDISLDNDTLVIEYHALPPGEIAADALSHPIAIEEFDLPDFNDVKFINLIDE